MPKGEITMDKDQYLQIINDQLKEAEANMNDAHKKFLEEKAKYDAIMRMRESYIKWVVEK
jgi:hypothetical protein